MRAGMTIMLAVIAGAAWSAPGEAPAPAARLVKTSGLVRVSKAGSDLWQDVKPPMDLAAGDQIKTAWGRAEIAFPNGAVVRLQRDTSFEVRAPEKNPQTGASRIVSFLSRGLLRAIVQPLKADEGFAVKSASAVCAVKGTDFAFDGSSVAVFDEKDGAKHEVTLSDPGETNSVIVGENMVAGFGADGALGSPSPLDPGQADRLRQSFEGEVGPPPSGGTPPAEPPTVGQGLNGPAAPSAPEPPKPETGPKTEEPPLLTPPPVSEGAGTDLNSMGTGQSTDPGVTDRVDHLTSSQPVVETPGLIPACGPDDHAARK